MFMKLKVRNKKFRHLNATNWQKWKIFETNLSVIAGRGHLLKHILTQWKVADNFLKHILTQWKVADNFCICTLSFDQNSILLLATASCKAGSNQCKVSVNMNQISPNFYCCKQSLKWFLPPSILPSTHPLVFNGTNPKWILAKELYDEGEGSCTWSLVK